MELLPAASIQETANQKNLLLLATLRWLAVGGQVVTILVVRLGFGIDLPLVPMAGVLLSLVALNLLSLHRCRIHAAVTNRELFLGLLFDVAALTTQLYLSGGATNPFVSLFLLQVILGAVLLRPVFTWTLVAATSFCFLALTRFHESLDLFANDGAHGGGELLELHVVGMFISFLLAAVLLVLFISRISGNLRDRDRRLAELRQQSAEEEHIVRMGLLASGAAHELGTPLATLSVILNDWERMPLLHADPVIADEIEEMQGALARCKAIVSRILLAAGEARGEDTGQTTLLGFLGEVVAGWRATRATGQVDYMANVGPDVAIASDSVIRQTLLNVLDNAVEASPEWVGIEAARRGDFLIVTVRDKGPGFAPEILANFGKPYQSTKKGTGNGLGLFLVVNVMRKLGGSVSARNIPDGGAMVELQLPLGALVIERRVRDVVG